MKRHHRVAVAARLLLAVTLVVVPMSLFAESFDLLKQKRIAQKDGGYAVAHEPEKWDASKSAVIVCDMWDAHHCLNATKRVGELEPRVNAFLKSARDHGAMIIHAPSSCMDFYEAHPARKRAQAAPKAANLPKNIEQWQHWINAGEQKAGYPIDHSDGGEDDDPEEHAAWAKKLKEEMGRNPRSPWIRQTGGIEIDSEKDAITDSGEENWNLLEARGIDNVMLVGVHTNMCVLGRPFGLRQLAKNGKNVVLVRDLTDTMYNPKMAPKVSHFCGTDLVIAHVEKFVCPTITSDQLLGDQRLRFKNDKRMRLAIVIAEDEYKTNETLPAFAEAHLARDFSVSYVFADPNDLNNLPAISALESSDVALFSVRRRTLPEKQLKYVRDFIAAGKPVVGIRTSSHAFSLRGKPAPEHHAAWTEFDAEVWGGNYHGHTGNELPTAAWIAKGKAGHAVFKGVDFGGEFATGGSLYRVRPLANGTEVLLMGRAGKDEKHEPVAWTNKTKWGGRAFYTSLGHPGDFTNPHFQAFLKNAVHWAAENVSANAAGK